LIDDDDMLFLVKENLSAEGVEFKKLMTKFSEKNWNRHNSTSY